MIDTRVSIVVPCHDLAQFHLLRQTVLSAQRQQPAPAAIVVAVDHNDELFDRATAELSGVEVVRNRYRRGVSGNRNSGAERTDTPLIAFLDGDTVAGPDWLARLVAPFEDPSVVGTGGRTEALWGRRPGWVPDEFLWAYGATHAGAPTRPAPVRNVWSANMAVRADAFRAAGGFHSSFGKVGDRSRPEDTEFCLRVTATSGGAWWFVPDAVIQHVVEAQRRPLRSFLTRCYNEGRGKIAMSRLMPAGATLGVERDYLRRTLPRAVGRDLRDAVTGRDRMGAPKAAAVVAGVLAAGAGAIVEYGNRGAA